MSKNPPMWLESERGQSESHFFPLSFVLCASIPHVPSNTSLETGKAFTEFGTLSPSCPLQRGLWSPSRDGRACGQSNLRHMTI